jgi:hypothetical protein
MDIYRERELVRLWQPTFPHFCQRRVLFNIASYCSRCVAAAIGKSRIAWCAYYTYITCRR